MAGGHVKLHRPELYRQWYNLCSMYPEKVHPAWLNVATVDYEEPLRARTLRFQELDQNKRIGYERFLEDFFRMRRNSPNIYTGTGFVNTSYYSMPRRLFMVVPRAQACIANYMPPSQKGWDRELLPSLPSTMYSKSVEVLSLGPNSIEVNSCRYKTEVDSEFPGNKESAINPEAQLLDVNALASFQIGPESMQMISLPKDMWEEVCFPEIPNTKEDRDGTDKLFYRFAPLMFNDAVRGLPSRSIYDGWHIRAHIIAYSAPIVLTPEEFHTEYDMDGIYTTDPKTIARLLARGCNVDDILKLSEILADLNSSGEPTDEEMSEAINTYIEDRGLTYYGDWNV